MPGVRSATVGRTRAPRPGAVGDAVCAVRRHVWEVPNVTKMSWLDFLTKVQNYCQMWHASVISWGRTRKRGLMLGSFPGSPHESWYAVDIVYDTVPPEAQAAATAKNLNLKLLREGHQNGDHLQPYDWVNEST